MAYGLMHAGEQPPVVMHLCDNPACCNPIHLRGGTQTQNVLDKVAKNRQAKGSSNGRAKLSESAVKRIKGLLFFEALPRTEITRQFNISPSVIRDIFNRKTWKHVDTFDFDDLFS